MGHSTVESGKKYSKETGSIDSRQNYNLMLLNIIAYGTVFCGVV